MLLVIIPVSIYFACVASAVRGSAVGQGLAFAVPAIAVWFAVMAMVYWFALVVSKFGRRSMGNTAARDSVELNPPGDFAQTDSETSSIEVSS